MAGEGGGEGACRNEQGAGGTRFIALLSDLVAQNSSPPLLVFSSSPLFTSSAFKPSICLGAGGRCTSLFTASADLVNSNLLPSISSPYIAAMSFDRLPIEIVHDVAGFLPSTDCTTVSRVSKTCRAAAEPHLYRDPVFFVNARSAFAGFLPLCYNAQSLQHTSSRSNSLDEPLHIWLQPQRLHRDQAAMRANTLKMLGPHSTQPC